jgi:hypothetical protein
VHAFCGLAVILVANKTIAKQLVTRNNDRFISYIHIQMATSPIRVGLIGLSGAAAEDYDGTSWTPNAHLPFLRASPHFEIVALLNSSLESAQAAIKKYGLPVETKAYGDPNGKLIDPHLPQSFLAVVIELVPISLRSFFGHYSWLSRGLPLASLLY